MNKPVISVVGAGYVGLCTALGFANKTFNVIVVDSDEKKITNIMHGIPPFHEPGLKERLNEALKNHKIECLHNQTQEGVLKTNLTFLAVGTPSRPDGSIDLQYIKAAARDIGKALKRKRYYHLVIVKSTVIPGTTQNVIKPILEHRSAKRCGKDWGLCMNPEFLRQGSAFEDTIHADRLVIGSFDKKSGDTLETVYDDYYGKAKPPTIRTSLGTAELIKYASNAILATKISFINMIANICEKIPGADVKVVAKAMGMDKRVGALFLDAGIGYGGSCFPKDVKALIACSKSLGYHPKLLESVEDINETQPLKIIHFCKEQLSDLKGKKIAILGLAFKPGTDDMREARVIPIINQLLNEGASITAYDPIAIHNAKTIFSDKISYAETAIACLKNADCAIMVTEWPEFQKLRAEDFAKNMKLPILIDGRRIYDPATYGKKIKFTAIGLGK